MTPLAIHMIETGIGEIQRFGIGLVQRGVDAVERAALSGDLERGVGEVGAGDVAVAPLPEFHKPEADATSQIEHSRSIVLRHEYEFVDSARETVVAADPAVFFKERHGSGFDVAFTGPQWVAVPELADIVDCRVGTDHGGVGWLGFNGHAMSLIPPTTLCACASSTQSGRLTTQALRRRVSSKGPWVDVMSR